MLERLVLTARLIAYLSLATLAGIGSVELYHVRNVPAAIVTASQRTNKVLLEAELTSMEIRKTSLQERKFLDQFGTQLNVTVKNLNATLVASHGALVQLQETERVITEDTHRTFDNTNNMILDVKPVTLQLQNILKSANGTVIDLDKVISDPALSSLAKHLDASSKNIEDTTVDVAATTKNVKVMSDDTKDYVHKLLHPPVWSQALTWTLRGVQAFKGWF